MQMYLPYGYGCGATGSFGTKAPRGKGQTPKRYAPPDGAGELVVDRGRADLFPYLEGPVVSVSD